MVISLNAVIYGRRMRFGESQTYNDDTVVRRNRLEQRDTAERWCLFPVRVALFALFRTILAIG